MGRKAQPQIKLHEINLMGMKILESDVKSAPGFNLSQVHGYDTHSDVTTEKSLENNLLRITFFVGISPHDKEEAPLPAGAQFRTQFIFRVNNLAQYIHGDDPEAEGTIDDALLARLTDTVYSSTRGVVFARTEDTIFEGIMLPMLDSAELLHV